MDEERNRADRKNNLANIGVQTNWLTRRQASSYIQVGISTLDKCIPIKKYYIGKSVRYLKKDLDEYLFSNCVEPNKGGNKNGV